MTNQPLLKQTHINTVLDFENALNEEQLKVVLSASGPSLVIAGAGSGKTRTLIYRVAKLIKDGVPPSRLLLVTFTNKAAREMLSRVQKLLSMDNSGIWGGTFHHIANLILRRHIGLLGFKHNFTILDEEDRKDLISDTITEFGLNDNRRFPSEDTVNTILSLSSNLSINVEHTVTKRFPQLTEYIDDLFLIHERLVTKKAKLNALDFDDLLLLLKQLLLEHDDVRTHYEEHFQHILVDEYQDTSKLQADIIDIISQKHRNLMVVGDDSQSIYAFRGAHYDNILGFTERYPDAVVYKLQTNYRSTQAILDLANATIIRNKKQYQKHLIATRGAGVLPVVVELESTDEQAGFIAKNILSISSDLNLNEIAVLYRSHYHSMEIQMELTRLGIPYEVRSGIRFFEQSHIKDVLSYLRFINNPSDELGFKRALKLYPGIGVKTSGVVWDFFSKHESDISLLNSNELSGIISKKAMHHLNKFYELLQMLSDIEEKLPSDMLMLILDNGYNEYLKLAYTNYETRLEDIKQLINYSTKFKNVTDFLSEMALVATVSASANDAGEKEQVVLSSIHQAKGLEWKAVFIPWLVDGKFPIIRGTQKNHAEVDNDAIEEERRLFYVAITRAKDILYLCYPEALPERGNYDNMITKPSRFIKELPSYAYEKWKD